MSISVCGPVPKFKATQKLQMYVHICRVPKATQMLQMYVHRSLVPQATQKLHMYVHMSPHMSHMPQALLLRLLPALQLPS